MAGGVDGLQSSNCIRAFPPCSRSERRAKANLERKAGILTQEDETREARAASVRVPFGRGNGLPDVVISLRPALPYRLDARFSNSFPEISGDLGLGNQRFMVCFSGNALIVKQGNGPRKIEFLVFGPLGNRGGPSLFAPGCESHNALRTAHQSGIRKRQQACRNGRSKHREKTLLAVVGVLIASITLRSYFHRKLKKRLPILRLAIVLSTLWLIGCALVLVLEFSLLPSPPRKAVLREPPITCFFENERINSVCVTHPWLGEVRFPSTMTEAEMEIELERLRPAFRMPTNALVGTNVKDFDLRKLSRSDFMELMRANANEIHWDIPDRKPIVFYRSKFNAARFMRLASLPAIAILAATLAIGFGYRWLLDGPTLL